MERSSLLDDLLFTPLNICISASLLFSFFFFSFFTSQLTRDERSDNEDEEEDEENEDEAEAQHKVVSGLEFDEKEDQNGCLGCLSPPEHICQPKTESRSL